MWCPLCGIILGLAGLTVLVVYVTYVCIEKKKLSELRKQRKTDEFFSDENVYSKWL